MSSFCSYFNQSRCRSCEWIEQDYASQIQLKELKIHEALGYFPSFKLESPAISQTQGFRNRAKMIVTGSVESPVIGLVGDTRLDQGREILTCPIHHPKLNELISAMPEWIRNYNLIPYQIQERKGELKALITFYSPATDQMYLRFVLRSKECIARIKKLLPKLQHDFPHLVCVSANIQPIPHAILEGPEEIIISTQNFIEHQIGSLRLNLAPQAFVQTHVQVATELYQTAAHWILEAKAEKVLELFCGQGAFSFSASKSANQILGIEINPNAVKTAQETASKLGLSHIDFKCLDATQVGLEIVEFQPDLVLVNPPRRGLAGGVQLIQNYLPRQFIYSSCSIDTLSVDLITLNKNYNLRKIRLFDLFPHTPHFETLVWLERNY